MFKAICKLGLEGIVSKKLNAPYKSGPSKAWLKIKNPEAPAATRAIEALFEPRIYSEFMNSTGGARVIVSTNLGMDRSVILVETAHSNKDLEVSTWQHVLTCLGILLVVACLSTLARAHQPLRIDHE
jgi:hypothetical protein